MIYFRDGEIYSKVSLQLTYEATYIQFLSFGLSNVREPICIEVTTDGHHIINSAQTDWTDKNLSQNSELKTSRPTHKKSPFPLYPTNAFILICIFQ